MSTTSAISAAPDGLPDELVHSLGDVAGSTFTNRKEAEVPWSRRREVRLDGRADYVRNRDSAPARLEAKPRVDVVRQHDRSALHA